MESTLDNGKRSGKVALLAPVFVILAGSLWGCMGLFVRSFTVFGLDSFQVVAVRAFFTAVLMIFILLLWNRSLLKIHLKDIWCFTGTGLCSIVFFNCCYFKNITITSMSAASVMMYTAPSFVMLLSALLFHERITRRKILSLILAFVGCVFVTGIIGSGARLTPMSILLGLGSGLGYALYSIFSRYALERGYHPLTIITWTFIFASFGILPFIRVEPIIEVALGSWKFVAFILLFVFVSTVLPYLVYTIGLQYVENSKAAIMASVEPVVATAIGLLVFKEQLTLYGLLGIVLVLLSIIICNISKTRRNE